MGPGISCFNQRRNDEPPRMTLRPLSVHLSSGVVISNSSLSLQDLDTPDNELIFVLTKLPDHGRAYTAMESFLIEVPKGLLESTH